MLQTLQIHINRNQEVDLILLNSRMICPSKSTFCTGMYVGPSYNLVTRSRAGDAIGGIGIGWRPGLLDGYTVANK